MREVDYRTYQKLNSEGSISKSSIPLSVFKSNAFKNLLDAEILEMKKFGRGLKIVVNKKVKFKSFFKTYFPDEKANKSKAGNIKKYRNSKSAKVELPPIFMLRGFQKFKVNGQTIDFEKVTSQFGLFSVIPKSIVANKVCFVENLETFLQVEKLLGLEYLYLHKYGRIGKKSLSSIKANNVLVFVDYDFNGLDEYLRIKEVFGNAELHLSHDYEEKFKIYSQSLLGNKAQMSKRVKNSTDETVIWIREQIAKNNRFLEQEIETDV